MTTLCMADYTDLPVRATAILHNPKRLWGALKNCAKEDGSEIARILPAISDHALMMHRLIYNLACREFEIEVTAHREDAHRLLARQQLRPESP